MQRVPYLAMRCSLESPLFPSCSSAAFPFPTFFLAAFSRAKSRWFPTGKYTQCSSFRIRTQLNTDPDPGFWWPKNEQNLHLKKMWIFFLSKIAIYLFLCLRKGRLTYMKSLQPSKENIQHFKIWNFLTSFYFVGHFCHSGSGSGIRIHWSGTLITFPKREFTD